MSTFSLDDEREILREKRVERSSCISVGLCDEDPGEAPPH